MNNTSDPCHIEDQETQFLFAKHILIAWFGTCLAVVGTYCNAIVAYILWSNAEFRTSSTIYNAVLSLFDTALCFSYIFLFTIENVFDYMQSYTLHAVWHSYVRVLYTSSRIVNMASVYLIVAASIDRLLNAYNCSCVRGNCNTKARLISIWFVVITSISVRSTTFWEIEVRTDDDCIGTLAHYQLDLSEFAKDPLYRKYFRLYFRDISQTVLPFLLLTIMNIAIIWKLRTTEATQRLMTVAATMRVAKTSSASMGGEKINNVASVCRTFLEVSQPRVIEYIPRIVHHPVYTFLEDQRARQLHHTAVRTATRTTVAIVTSYLITNSLSFVVTMTEHIDQDFLYAHFAFYTFSADVITQLHLLCSTARIAIYCVADPRFRKRVQLLHKRMATCLKRSRVAMSSELNGTTSDVALDETPSTNRTMDDSFLLKSPAAVESASSTETIYV